MAQQIVRLAQKSLVYGLGQVLLRTLNLLLLPLFTAYLSPTEYGVYAILGLLAFVLTPIVSLGFGIAIGMCYIHHPEPEWKAETIWSAFWLLATSSSLLAVLGVRFAREISLLAFQTPTADGLVLLTCLTVCLSALALPFMIYLQLEERAAIYVVITVASALASIGLSVVMVVIQHRGLQGLVAANLIGQAVGTILFLVAAVVKITPRWSRSLAQTLLRTGAPLIPAFAFIFIVQQGNKYLLQWFSGLDAVGVYSIGFSIGAAMSLVVGGLTSAWTPYFLSFADRQDEARLLFGRILTYYVFGFGVLSLVFYMAAKPLVLLMTAPAFHGAYVVIGPSATSQYLIGVFSILLPAMYFAQEVKYVTLIHAVAATAAVLLNLLLIPPFGVGGAAIGLVLGSLGPVVVQQAWSRTRRQRYLAIVYQWDRVLKFAACYVIYMVILLWDWPLTLGGQVLLSLAAAATLPILLYLFLSPTERDALRTHGKRVLNARRNPVTAPADA